MYNTATSKWIAPRPDQSTAVNPSFGNLPGQYTYRTTFDLTGFKPQTATVTGQWSSDNVGLDILVNGVSTGITNRGQFLAFSAFAINSGFVSGLNTLDFIVDNAATFSPNPTGLQVQLSVSADPVPAPSAPALSPLGLAALVLVLSAVAFRRLFLPTSVS